MQHRSPTSVPCARMTLRIAGSYYFALYVRTNLALVVAASIGAIGIVRWPQLLWDLYEDMCLLGANDQKEEIVQHILRTNGPVDYGQPLLSQSLEYVIGVLTWWPIALFLAAAAIVTVVAERRRR